MEKEEKNPQGSPAATDNKYLWIVGFVLLLLGGWFVWNMLFGVSGDYKVTFIDAPKEVFPGLATFTWRVDGPATVITNTEIYFGPTSNPGELSRDVKPGDTKYTDFVKDFASGKYNIPLQFIGNTYTLTAPGKYYFRGHAFIKNKHYWTDEYTLEVKKPEYKVTLLSFPKEINLDAMATFTWRVDGVPTSINHTSVHLGQVSTTGELGKDVKPGDTKYTTMFIKDFVSGKYDIPLQFVGNLKMTSPGIYYLRAHAVIEGKNYWTDEYTLEVKETK